LECYVYCGYAEVEIQQDNSEKYYNAAYLIDPTGKLEFNYRKTHLYIADKVWQC
jgi:protein N-terminal amidase